MNEMGDERLKCNWVAEDGEDVEEVDSLREVNKLSRRNWSWLTNLLWKIAVLWDDRLRVLNIGHGTCPYSSLWLQGQGGNTREEMNLGFVILIYCFKNFPSDNRLIVVM